MDDTEPRQPYRGGDLESAARRAAEDAVTNAPATPPLNEDLVADIRASAGGDGPAAGATPDAVTTPAEVEEAPDAVTTPVEVDEAADDDSLQGSFLAFLRELPVLLAVAFLLAFLLRTFVVQVFYIPSGSMRPLMEVDDRIVVEKLSYRFSDPQRGDVVVFAGPDQAADPVGGSFLQRFTRGAGQFLGVVPANAQDFVKRVIGLPGDHIEIVSGIVYVNGVALDEPYAVEDPRSFGPWTVPEGMLFFLGDNRPNSADSRIPTGLGFVSEDHVVGRALVIVWPLDHVGGIGRLDYPGVPENPPPDAAE